jgi:hypothetical protein
MHADSERTIPTLTSCSIDTFCLSRIVLKLLDFLLADNSLHGANFGVLRRNDPQDVKLEKNTWWESTFVRQTASFALLCVKLYLPILSLEPRDSHVKNDRKMNHKNVLLSRSLCVKRPLEGGCLPFFAGLFASQALSNAQSFIVINKGVSIFWGVKIPIFP